MKASRRPFAPLLAPALLVASMALNAPATATAAAKSAAPWTPEPATYGVGEQRNVPVSMQDGTVLRANVFFPTELKTGKPASGPFPVIMVQNPYGKDTVGALSGQTGGAEAGTEAGAVPYLVRRGYIDVVAEVRGTGDSGGTFDLLAPIQGQDGAQLVYWAAALPHSSGRVGLYGPSYMGIDQFMTAAALPLGSPLQALFPIVAANDPYRDLVFDGGLIDLEGDFVLNAGALGALHLLNPLVEAQSLTDLLQVESQHLPALASYNLTQILSVLGGGDQAYDGSYWQTRTPGRLLARVVANRVPAYLVGGYYDVFQRGEPLNYAGLQNAWAGRPAGAPMAPKQRVTGRYQLLDGPWYHLDAGTGIDIYAIQLAWFDRWLKGEPTGIERTSTPLHLYEQGSGRWVDASRYPLDQTKPTTLYLDRGPSASHALSGNDGTLTRTAPTSARGADRVLFTGLSSPCSRSTEQWGFGALALVLGAAHLPPDPCSTDDRALELGPGALTYTTAPVTTPTVLAGPVDATVFATSTRPEVELVATLEDVAPGGTSTPISSGALLGSFRALDSGRTWWAPGGRPLAPYHPYTKASVAAVPAGNLTRYDIEIFPTVDELLPGHRLRLTLTTSDLPHLLPPPSAALALLGGQYELQRSRAAASYLEVPLADASRFHPGSPR